MTDQAILNISGPVESVDVVDHKQMEQAMRTKAEVVEYQQARRQFQQACEALSSAAAELERYCTTLFSSHREQIVRLSLEIASRILGRQIAEQNYAIETIVLEALAAAPQSKQLTVRLNPDDVTAFEKVAAEQAVSLPPNVHVAADWSVKPAECAIDSDQGIVESMIDEHLRHIGQALLQAKQEDQ